MSINSCSWESLITFLLSSFLLYFDVLSYKVSFYLVHYFLSYMLNVFVPEILDMSVELNYQHLINNESQIDLASNSSRQYPLCGTWGTRQHQSSMKSQLQLQQYKPEHNTGK